MKNIFSVLSLILTISMLSFGVQAGEASVEPSDIEIQNTDSVLYISIQGDKIQSVDDIHKLFIKALNLPASYSKTFEGLQAELIKYKAKSFQVTVVKGGYLGLSIGQENHDKLLEVLNNAQEKNLDQSGYPYLMVYYWQ